MDGRRRRYVPLDVNVAHKPFGQALQERFGNDGLLVWMLLLAAAKLGVYEGQFEWRTETDAWAQIGLIEPPRFTFAEFLKFTGQWKKTRIRREGHVNNCSIRAWTDWNNEWRRQQGAEQKSRKRGTNTETMLGKYDAVMAPEVEVEVKPLAAVKQITEKRPDQLLWDALAAALGRPAIWKPTDSERGKMNRAIKELLAVGALPGDVDQRARKWRERYKSAELTPQALAGNWTSLGPTAAEIADLEQSRELARRLMAQNGNRP